MTKTVVTKADRDELLVCINRMKSILDNYAWFEPNNRYIATSVARSKNTADQLLALVNVLPTIEEG